MAARDGNRYNEARKYDWDRDKFEYQMAQEMLRHYDSLNWQIGSILIAGTLVLTALVFNKDTVKLLHDVYYPAVAILLTATVLSAFVLGNWLLWFRRHRAYYNLRNEVFHRIELKRQMFHYLSVVEADLPESDEVDMPKIRLAAKQAGYGTAFEPFKAYPQKKLPKPSGSILAHCLAVGIPVLQLIGTAILMALHHCKKLG